MLNFKTLTIWVVILNFFIIVGVGHGIVPIGLLEIIGIFKGFGIPRGDFSLSMTASFERSLTATALFFLIGQVFLILSISIKNRRGIFWFKILGLFFLWTDFTI